MSDNHPIHMSLEGVKKLERELYELLEIQRPDMLMSLQEAREKGDLSENAEYSAAREGLTQIDMQISRIQKLLSRVVLIDENSIQTDQVGLLNTIVIENTKTKKRMTYKIVSPEEADPRAGKISSTSPVGKALLGKKVGDEVEVEVPAGIVHYKIIEIGK
ncbi:MAG: transcription elongation factor GreA [bacterium]|nr:transcription elongation factor GreA [bacterium]